MMSKGKQMPLLQVQDMGCDIAADKPLHRIQVLFLLFGEIEIHEKCSLCCIGIGW